METMQTQSDAELLTRVRKEITAIDTMKLEKERAEKIKKPITKDEFLSGKKFFTYDSYYPNHYAKFDDTLGNSIIGKIERNNQMECLVIKVTNKGVTLATSAIGESFQRFVPFTKLMVHEMRTDYLKQFEPKEITDDDIEDLEFGTLAERKRITSCHHEWRYDGSLKSCIHCHYSI